jgi:ankyrin repeat protein
VLESFEDTSAHDNDSTRRAQAAFMLSRMYLAPDDFGLHLDIEKGLRYLILSAERGSRECQALVLRWHHAFSRPVPTRIEQLIRPWLLSAGSTGSLTALEDMKRFGYNEELAEASKLLKTRYCGVGYEIFEYEEEAVVALTDQFRTAGKQYIDKEIVEGNLRDKDLRGYLLRLSAAYGCPKAIDYLVNDLGTNVNAQNEFGETALLFAARSGHTGAVLLLLERGASPTLPDRGNDTPLHWLSSFDEDDVYKVVHALVRQGADIEAQADSFPYNDRLEYAEMEFVAGTPLHRAICRNNLPATRELLQLGANANTATLVDDECTPIALAARLHYPESLKACLDHIQDNPEKNGNKLVTPRGKSLLIPAIRGGSVEYTTMGRLIRHGDRIKTRAIQTLQVLLEAGAGQHLSDLPGEPRCTAMFYAARYQPYILDCFGHTAANADINRLSRRYNADEEEEEDMKRPPLFEAILWGKPANALKLLEVGADAMAVENAETKLSALYQCASASLEEIEVAAALLDRGLGVDAGPPGYETPFQCAVRNGCYRLADFLRSQGANVNALCRGGLMWKSSKPESLLSLLARNNGGPSISGLRFLLDSESAARCNFLAEPTRNHSVFHVFAQLDGDSLDTMTTERALQICYEYYDPSPAMLNLQSRPHENADGSVEARGGNTALHYATIHANFEVVKFLLNAGADASIRNDFGMTALDMATLSYPTFKDQYEFRPIPKSPLKQLRDAQTRRDGILSQLQQHTPEGVNTVILEKYTVGASE